MKCPKCRTELTGNPPFCPGCGIQTRNPSGPKARAAGKPKNTLTIGRMLIIGGILLVVLIIFILRVMSNI